MPTFKTIRQVAALGVLPEHRLRLMQKQGLLPGIQSGNRFLINVEVLVAQLNEISTMNVRSETAGNLRSEATGK